MKRPMRNRQIYLRKSAVYQTAFGVALVGLLAGDALSPSKISARSNVVPASYVSIDPDSWKSLAAVVRKQASRFSGESAYIIKDLHSGQQVESQGDQIFPSASLIKLPIMCAAFQAVEEGKLALSAPITYTRQDRRGGSGILKRAQPGTVFTNRELLEAMIVHSDNSATELIVRQLGIDYLQDTFRRLGLKDTQIHAEGFRLVSRAVVEDNVTSPRDMAFLLERIYRRELVSASASDQMLDILKHQHLRDRLPRYMPNSFQIAHKTGLLRRACHDVGIVFTPRGDYMICVLTSHDKTYKVAKHFIASMGRITFDYYQGGARRPVIQTSLPTGRRTLSSLRRGMASSEPSRPS